jgi:hypothetical protein
MRKGESEFGEIGLPKGPGETSFPGIILRFYSNQGLF